MPAFITDKHELIKKGLIIFRRGDLQNREWYCRVKVPKSKRYKVAVLKTLDFETAKERAIHFFYDVKAKVENNYPVFNRSFREVAQEYLALQEKRAQQNKISKGRPLKMKAVIEGALDVYAGSKQVDLIGDELWADYPDWRRENGEGRNTRNGTRTVSRELAVKLVRQEQAMKEKTRTALGFTARQPMTPAAFEKAVAAKLAQAVPYISDATISFEMSIFGAVMNYAIKKDYAPVSQRFDQRPKLRRMRRDEFTREEYRKLHTVGRAWVAKASKPSSRWTRTVVYYFILIMCNTGMRPSEAKNLRWRDIMPAKDRDGREITVLFVQGKGKSRKLVAPKSVGDYLERICAIAKATGPDDRVFTIINGKPALTLYKVMIDSLLTEAGLRDGPHGVPRSTYCFRHTYATFRLSEGVDVYFLAEQMGTSVKMIEDHYGHVNTIKHADRVLMGMGGWEPVEMIDPEGDAKGKAAAKAKKPAKPRTKR
jgi:integrase